jgi:hypothetical protein
MFPIFHNIDMPALEVSGVRLSCVCVCIYLSLSLSLSLSLYIYIYIYITRTLFISSQFSFFQYRHAYIRCGF